MELLKEILNNNNDDDDDDDDDYDYDDGDKKKNYCLLMEVVFILTSDFAV